MSDGEREDDELEALLRSLDNDPPRTTAEAVMARARRSRRAPLRLAAGIAAALGLAGVAYALPGSPLPAWARAALEPVLGAGGGGAESEPLREDPTAETGGGMLFDPAEPLDIRIESRGAGHLRILPTGDGELVALMVSGVARFTSDPGRLRVELGEADTLELRIPAAASSVTITADGRSVYSKRGRDVATVLVPDPAGWYGLDLDAPR